MSQEAISQLLSQAGEAHQDYEQTVLHGVYDEEWPAWYADHVIELGLNVYLQMPVTVAQLGPFLTASNQRYEQTDKSVTWSDFTAADIVEYFD